jgi:hypothetical protein
VKAARKADASQKDAVKAEEAVSQKKAAKAVK